MPLTHVAIAVWICDYCDRHITLSVADRAVDLADETVHLNATGWEVFGNGPLRVVACDRCKVSPTVAARKEQLAKTGGLE